MKQSKVGLEVLKNTLHSSNKTPKWSMKKQDKGHVMCSEMNFSNVTQVKFLGKIDFGGNSSFGSSFGLKH